MTLPQLPFLNSILDFVTSWPLMLSALVAFIPVCVWTYFVYSKKNETEKAQNISTTKFRFVVMAFLLGTCTVPILLGYYSVLSNSPSVDYYEILRKSIVEPATLILEGTYSDSPEFLTAYDNLERAQNVYDTITIVIDAFLEEVIKISLLILFLSYFKLIRTIGDAIMYSVLAGLGFAYMENLVFFKSVFEDASKSVMVYINVVIFRTIVLTVGHMVFSGIFGYFYGLSKFALPIYEEEKWEGEKYPMLRWISKVAHVSIDKIYAVFIVYEGLIIAMLTHASFNTFLGFGLRDYAVYLVILAGIYVYYLTQRKAGHLVLASLGKSRMSLMAPRDEEVILELAGMWINEGKYKEVEEICARLEQKDPDNAVVKLLYAKAHDKRRVKRARLAMLSLFFQQDIFEDDRSIFDALKKNEAH